MLWLRSSHQAKLIFCCGSNWKRANISVGNQASLKKLLDLLKYWGKFLFSIVWKVGKLLVKFCSRFKGVKWGRQMLLVYMTFYFFSSAFFISSMLVDRVLYQYTYSNIAWFQNQYVNCLSAVVDEHFFIYKPVHPFIDSDYAVIFYFWHHM